MNQNKYKLLFIEVADKTEQKLKKLLHDSEHNINFCSLKDCRAEISLFHPDILIALVYENFKFNGTLINELKRLSEELTIPFTVLLSSCLEDDYHKLIKHDIRSMITLPLHRDVLLKALERTVNEYEPDRDKDPSGSSLIHPEVGKTLIFNLVKQNSALKSYLKKENRTSELYHRIHYDRVEEIRSMENMLWESLENGYFKLYYQPVISLDNGKISGFEALIRLVHPEQGIIPPDKFIGLAEKSAIIFPLGLWIVEEACRQINLWKSVFASDFSLRVNINLSAKQFIHPELAEHIFEITEKYEVNENDIAFEVTESAFMEDMESANLALLKLRSRKFSIYMDDFGTGYSSLSYLMHFPVNVIKIDQSFVKWMHIDEQSEIIVKSIIMLAHNLGLKVVAEGTEDLSQIEMLKNFGCDYAQGYYFAKPLPESETEAFIKNNLNMD